MLCDPLLPDGQEYVTPRDLAGTYVLLASVDINFAIRDLLSNRNLAAMITWTEVVMYSMFDFLKVNCNQKIEYSASSLKAFKISHCAGSL